MIDFHRLDKMIPNRSVPKIIHFHYDFHCDFHCDFHDNFHDLMHNMKVLKVQLHKMNASLSAQEMRYHALCTTHLNKFHNCLCHWWTVLLLPSLHIHDDNYQSPLPLHNNSLNTGQLGPRYEGQLTCDITKHYWYTGCAKKRKTF